MSASDRGRLEAIWIKSMRRGPMLPRNEAVLRAARGLVGNTDQRGKRQVTVIQQERWKELMRALGADLGPENRRANLMISTLDLEDSHGRILQIGDCRLRVLGETRPCERMDEALSGLQEAMRSRWGGGVFTEVLDDGTIRIGDPVVWISPTAR